MKNISLILIVLISIVIAGGAVLFSEYSAQPEANKVRISWITTKENGVKSFIIKRSADNKQFTTLVNIKAEGPGYRYEYVDQDVRFQGTNVLYYKIAAVSPTGEVIAETGTMNVLPNISGIFRTWGAIKAVFR